MLQGRLNRNKAQAAIELAVFGAIVIFVVGMIVRTAVSNSYTMNQNLKAMRYAMLKSLQTSASGSTSRNSASVLYIEDRLSPDFSKYGSLDRTPYFAQGSGTFTNLLFYSVDPDEVEQNLPTMDIYINGVHLPLTTAALREIVHQPPVLKAQWDEIQKHNRQQISYIDVLVDYGIYDRYERFYNGDVAVPDPLGKGTHRYHGWDFKCTSEEIDNPAAPGTKIKRYYGCQMYYTLVPNGRTGWCVREPCNDGSPLNLDERFDLNRNDDFSDDPKDDTRTKVPRSNMAWQWRAVKGLFSVSELNGRSSAANSRYPSFDINNDRKEETLYAAIVPKTGSAVVKDIALGETALDFTAGDIDLSRDDSDEGQVGLQSDTAIYTRPRTGPGVTGTYLEIRNGKLFEAGSNTVVRSLNKRDTVDIIERRIRLSNNTGRFCQSSYECQGGLDASGNCPSGIVQLVTVPPSECIGGLTKVNGVCPAGENPVEVCAASDTSVTTNTNPIIGNDCFTQANVAKTCMDVSTNIIYVRSRLMDSQGHKWTTDVSGLSRDAQKKGTQSWGELGVK